jgi:hypothetical protein
MQQDKDGSITWPPTPEQFVRCLQAGPESNEMISLQSSRNEVMNEAYTAVMNSDLENAPHSSSVKLLRNLILFGPSGTLNL